MLGTRWRISRRRSHGSSRRKRKRSVEGGAAPHFQAEEIWEALRDGGGGRENVVGADARGHQRLVRIAEGGVGDEQALFFARPCGELFWAEHLQHLARAGRRTDAGRLGEHGGFEIFGDFLPFYFGIAVEDYVAEIRKELCGAVAAARETEKLRGIVEERRGDFAGAEFRMIDDVFDEGNVGGNAADAEFAQGAVHAATGFGEIFAPCGDFD